MIVPGGGLSLDGARWVNAANRKCLLAEAYGPRRPTGKRGFKRKAGAARAVGPGSDVVGRYCSIFG
jgi:hypothetical protein